MPCVRYVSKKFSTDSLAIIAQANAICDEYQGVSLTLRQLYYQFVSRGSGTGRSSGRRAAENAALGSSAALPEGRKGLHS